MKYILPFLLSCFWTISFSQQITYPEWEEEAKHDIRMLPRYGNFQKPAAQIEADEKFIQTSVKREGSREKASQQMIANGFRSIDEGDMKTAMYQFNQAWLLDPKNEDTFRGFGTVYFIFSDYQTAIYEFDAGLVINPRNAGLLAQKASLYMGRYEQNGKKRFLEKATEWYKKSYEVDPQNQNTLFKLSACYFFKDDCVNAVRYLEECKALGGNLVTPEYEATVINKCGK